MFASILGLRNIQPLVLGQPDSVKYGPQVEPGHLQVLNHYYPSTSGRQDKLLLGFMTGAIPVTPLDALPDYRR